MSRPEDPVAKIRQVWIAGLVVLSLAMAWICGTLLIKTMAAVGSATTFYSELSQVDVAILTASGSTPRYSEVRSGHDPDDIALNVGAVCLPPVIVTDSLPQPAVERCAQLARPWLQARAPPLI